jgi:hypothetical protein
MTPREASARALLMDDGPGVARLLRELVSALSGVPMPVSDAPVPIAVNGRRSPWSDARRARREDARREGVAGSCGRVE